jgi:hypothetical protein
VLRAIDSECRIEWALRGLAVVVYPSFSADEARAGPLALPLFPLACRLRTARASECQDVSRDMDEVPFVEIFSAVQPFAAHAAAIENIGETALDDLVTFAHRLLADSRVQAVAVCIALTRRAYGTRVAAVASQRQHLLLSKKCKKMGWSNLRKNLLVLNL